MGQKRAQGLGRRLGVVGLVLIGLALAGCGSMRLDVQMTPLPMEMPSPQPRNYKGTITCVGSSILAPILVRAGERFHQSFPNAHILVITATSQAGLAAVRDGGADIGLSDVDAVAFAGLDHSLLHDYPLATTIYAVITHADVGLAGLSQADLGRIYTGSVRNWQAVGGPNLPIDVVSWPKGAGPRQVFRQLMLAGTREDDEIATPQEDNEAVAAAVATRPGAIGYVALSALRPDVRVLTLNGTAPQAEAVRLGHYAFWSVGHAYTKGEAGGLTAAFLDQLLSRDVQLELFKTQGFIPVADMPPPTAP